jgi:hypothetical protein
MRGGYVTIRVTIAISSQQHQPQLVDCNGRGGGIRTRDPLRPRQVRYQAALRPDRPLV